MENNPPMPQSVIDLIELMKLAHIPAAVAQNAVMEATSDLVAVGSEIGKQAGEDIVAATSKALMEALSTETSWVTSLKKQFEASVGSETIAAFNTWVAQQNKEELERKWTELGGAFGKKLVEAAKAKLDD